MLKYVQKLKSICLKSNINITYDSEIYNYINNEQQFNDYLLNSTLQNQEPANIIFVFLGMNQEAFRVSLQNLQSKNQDQNPSVSSFGVQFTTAKPKVQQLSFERWLEKGQVYLKECQNNFLNRTFILFEFDLQKLEFIIKQFEYAEQQSQIEDYNEIDFKESDEDVGAQKNIVIIYPLMIPGSGKSTLVEYLKNNYQDYPFFDICADQITLQLIKDKLGESTDSQTIQFQKVFLYIKEAFQQKFLKKINEIINSNDEKAVLLIDCNCVSHTLLYMINHIKAIQTDIALKKGASIKIYNVGSTLPFCFDYALTILNRLLIRNDQEMMFFIRLKFV